MTLLISIFAAVIFTFLWYKNAPEDKYKFSFLCWIFWGASLMWLVDAIFEFIEQKEEYFTPAATDMVNDAFLGLSVVALGMVVWIVYLIIKDPKRVVKSSLIKKETI
ncbi:MAG: hypothetical protein J6A01_06915 [Proteobacteria bacterium]|nr:hypothetical protein [Pseudomonadota bacterium]